MWYLVSKDIHYSVLLEESIDSLEIDPNGVYVDATLGMGGHSEKILEQLDKGHLYSFDQDESAIKIAKKRLSQYSNFTIIKSNFSNLKSELEKLNVNKIDGIIYDLGVSSLQFDEDSRGFSYRFDAKLDMRMNLDDKISAYEVINNYSFEELRDVFYKYGEEKFSPQIARKICEKRELKNIETTFELVDIIKSSLTQKRLKQKGHPAKKVFQALRIEVNKELNVLKQSLEQAVEILNINGRIAVISFQSLEDKVVKSYFKKLMEVDVPKEIVIVPDHLKPILEKVTRKNIKPSEKELSENHRSHSAQLRVVKKVKDYE